MEKKLGHLDLTVELFNSLFTSKEDGEIQGSGMQVSDLDRADTIKALTKWQRS